MFAGSASLDPNRAGHRIRLAVESRWQHECPSSGHVTEQLAWGPENSAMSVSETCASLRELGLWGGGWGELKADSTFHSGISQQIGLKSHMSPMSTGPLTVENCGVSTAPPVLEN